MKWLGYPIYRLVLAYSIGLIASYYCDWDISVLIYSLVLLTGCIVVSIIWSRRMALFKAIYSLSVLLFFVVLACYNWTIRDPIHQVNHYSNYISNDNQHLIQFTLSDQLTSTSYNDRYYAQVSRLDHHAVNGKMLVYSNIKDSLLISIGQQVSVYASITQPNSGGNPGDFNYNNYLKSIDVYGQVRLNSGNLLAIDTKASNTWIYQLRLLLEQALERSGLQQQPLAMVKALLLGQRYDVDPSVTQSFRDAGVVHILALSGLHVGIILLILQTLTKRLQRLKWGKWIQSLIIIVLLWLFALLSGMSASILRAVTMFSFIAIAINMNRKTAVIYSLALSAFVLLLFNPKLLFQVGFQLSYTAVIAIVLIQPIIYKLWSPRYKVVNYYWQIVTVTVAAQIGVAPLSIYYFNQFPGLFLIGNMILLPILPIIIAVSIVIIILSLGNLPVNWLSRPVNVILDRVIDIVSWLGNQDQFIIKQIYIDTIELVLIYIIIFSLALFFYRSTRRSRKERVMISKPGYNMHLAIASLTLLLGYKSYRQLQPQTDQWYVLHQYYGSAVCLSNIIEARLWTNFGKLDSTRIHTSLDRIKSITPLRNKQITIDSLRNKISYQDIDLTIIDQSGIVLPTQQAQILLMSHSPKVHLGKIITQLQPQYIIADASNYHSDIERWSKTCKQRNVTFISTYKSGAIDLINLVNDTEN